MSARTLTVLGSTGTVGMSTLDVVARHRERFRIAALTAHTDVDRLFAQVREFQPRYAVLADADSAAQLSEKIRSARLDTEVLHGAPALERVASLPEVDTVMAAIVGAAALKPTLAAARAGKRLLLANKEALVMAGEIVLAAARASGALLVPIDSEHNAIFQALPNATSRNLGNCGVRKILLTASGGPFRALPPEALEHVTPEQACKHPNWVMGRKISVDSATMMNKGLEVIEACRLFDARLDQIEIVLHPESVVHSMVSYNDGSVIAQLSNPDMRTPIAYGLSYPERIDAGVLPLDLTALGCLNFAAFAPDRAPCVGLALDAGARGGTAPAVLNAANEIAVHAFLNGAIKFTDIARVIEYTLSVARIDAAQQLDAVLDADAKARSIAQNWVHEQGNVE